MSPLLLFVVILIYGYVASLFIRACRPPPDLALYGESTDFSRNMPPALIETEGDVV